MRIYIVAFQTPVLSLISACLSDEHLAAQAEAMKIELLNVIQAFGMKRFKQDVLFLKL